ncbi:MULTISPECIES: LysM peptidoglycan-binding domain-containing protein [Microbacterium]|uniref:LysM peptidoglycan-binding domain-containing protein n=1 Tax=Microbacterium TaxID=33882 RepID=UPI001CB71578|nr:MULTISPECIES: LysM peptidoglycan-binding domain-containing protein [Microbacterium]
MRPDTRTRGIRSFTAAPAAVCGSIALVLTAAPAHAADPASAERMQRPLSLDATVRTPMATKAPAPTTAIPSRAVALANRPATYTVQRGDTVSAIAARFGLRTVDVLALNGLSWSSVIYPGQVLTLVGGAAVTPAAPAAPVAASVVHAVRPGDTVSAIAKRHGLSVPTVLKANGLSWSSIIYPGQKLTIPGNAAPAASAPAAPATPAAPAAPTPAAGSYVVKAGDTVTSIASRHGVTIQAVLAANTLQMSSIIYPGQKLVIPPQGGLGLDAEQIDNARLIIQIGRELGVPDRGIAIALGTAMQESWIRNLDGGDRDSLGLFQQRPSTGWGTADQVRDRVRATQAFYGGPADPNGTRTRGLLDIPGWQSMTFAQAAQAVQISAYPDRYAQWEKPAHAWLAALG